MLSPKAVVGTEKERGKGSGEIDGGEVKGEQASGAYLKLLRARPSWDLEFENSTRALRIGSFFSGQALELQLHKEACPRPKVELTVQLGSVYRVNRTHALLV